MAKSSDHHHQPSVRRSVYKWRQFVWLWRLSIEVGVQWRWLQKFNRERSQRRPEKKIKAWSEQWSCFTSLLMTQPYTYYGCTEHCVLPCTPQRKPLLSKSNITEPLKSVKREAQVSTTQEGKFFCGLKNLMFNCLGNHSVYCVERPVYRRWKEVKVKWREGSIMISLSLRAQHYQGENELPGLSWCFTRWRQVGITCWSWGDVSDAAGQWLWIWKYICYSMTSN